MVAFARWADWKRLVIASSTEQLFSLAAGELNRCMQLGRMRPMGDLRFESGIYKPEPTLAKIATLRTQVIVLMCYGDGILSFALAARERGMLSAGWAWLGLTDVVGAEVPKATELQDVPRELAAAVMQGWVYFEPHNNGTASFFERVRNASRDYYPGVYDSSRPTSTYAANLYDAIMLFAVTAARLQATGAELSGKGMAAAMLNVSLDGMTGRVELDEHGDLKESIRAMNYVRQSAAGCGQWASPECVGTKMIGTQIGIFDGVSHVYTPAPSQVVQWPSGTTDIPSTPTLEEDEGFSTAYVLAGAGTAAAIVVVGLVVVVRKKGLHLLHLQQILQMLFTEATQLVGTFLSDLADVITDVVTCSRVLSDELPVPSKVYKSVYAVFTCFGAAGVIVSVAYRLYNSRLVMEHVRELQVSEAKRASLSEGRCKLQVYEWELAQTFREARMLALALLSLVIQGAFRQSVAPAANALWGHTWCGADLPMTIMNICIILVSGSLDRLVRPRYGIRARAGQCTGIALPARRAKQH